MIQSMTGYGKTEVLLATKKISIEIKSLNSKNLDLNVRMPALYKEKELSIRKNIAQKASRGKLECSIYVEQTGTEALASLNADVIKKYMAELEVLVPKAHIEHLKIAVKLPEALKTEKEDLDPAEWQAIEKALTETLIKFNAYRTDEGISLAKDISQNVALIQQNLEAVLTQEPNRISAKKERLRKALADLNQQIDENRFEQELIYYIEKLDINEEEVRLKNHLKYFAKVLNESQSNGKKLGFIAQEMGREINTIGSKANDAIMQQSVVKMKDALEKIKEQLLNVL